MNAATQVPLPEGWTHVRFGDVVRNKNLTTKNPERDGLDRIVGLTHLDSESLPIVRWDMLEDETSFSRTFAAGDVLFGKRRAYQRKVGVPHFAGICSGDILVFESKDPSLLQEFLPYIVQSDAFFERAVGTSAGSLSPRTNWTQLARFEFALPPIEEQKRIVELLCVADEAGSAHLAVADSAQAAVEAWLLKALPSQAEWPRLSQIAQEHRVSWDPQRAIAGEQVLHWSIPALDETGGPLLEDASRIGSSKFRVEADALLVSRLNPRIPRVFVAAGSSSAVCSTEFSVLTSHESAVPLRVLREILLLPVVWGQVEARAKGSTKSRERVAPRDLMSIRVPLVDALPLQEISAFLIEAATLRQGVHEHLARTKHLQASLREASLRGDSHVL